MFYPPLIGYLIVGLTCGLLVAAIQRNRLGRNSVIEIRSRHILRSDAAWASDHRAACPALIAIVIISVAFALGLLAVGLSVTARSLGDILAVSGWVVVLVACVFVWIAANRGARSAAN